MGLWGDFCLAIQLPGVFQESSKLPLEHQKVSQLARHLHTNTTYLICGEGYECYAIFMNIDSETWANRLATNASKILG